MFEILTAALFLLIIFAGMAEISFSVLRRHGLQRCICSYAWNTRHRREPANDRKVHVLFCFTDHFEPLWGGALDELGMQRVQKWCDDYPALFGHFRDSDGKPPRWTFFYPAEEYRTEYLDRLAQLCRDGYGEVEIHLHHHQDTSDGLSANLVEFRNTLAERHGLLARDMSTGAVKYGFIHGNWALCNAHGNGRFCGVNEELDILRETGCYADFTMPSAPDSSQTARINSIYYARTVPGKPRSHDRGVAAGGNAIPGNSLLLIQGPLVLNWRDRKKGILPRLENGCLQGSQPPSISRLADWLRASVQVAARPDWYFVKLHMHGTEDGSLSTLLGEPMVQFHNDLAKKAKHNPHFHFHYVTAREMYNLVKAAEAGWAGSVSEARNFELVWNGGT